MPEEGQVVGERLMPEGWCKVIWKQGKECVQPVEIIDGSVDLSPKFRDKHRFALNAVYGAIGEFKVVGRSFPLLRTEAQDRLGLDKNVLKELESFGLIESTMIAVETKDGRKLGGRLAIYPSAMGLRLMRLVDKAVSEVTSVEPVALEANV